MLECQFTYEITFSFLIYLSQNLKCRCFMYGSLSNGLPCSCTKYKHVNFRNKMAFDAFSGLLVLLSSVFVIVAPSFGQMYQNVPMQQQFYYGGPIMPIPMVPMFSPNFMMSRNVIAPQPQMFLRPPIIRNDLEPAVAPVWSQNYIQQPVIRRRISVRPQQTAREPFVMDTRGPNHINRKVVIPKPKLQNSVRPVTTKPTMPGKHNVLNYVRPHPKQLFPSSYQKKSLFPGVAKAKHFRNLIGG